jgi:hypothetical protein
MTYHNIRSSLRVHYLAVWFYVHGNALSQRCNSIFAQAFLYVLTEISCSQQNTETG